MVGVVALAYVGLVASQVLLHGPQGHETLGPPEWSARAILGAVCFPTVFALWWRRRDPIIVLAITLAAVVIAYPYPSVLATVALYSAAANVEARPTTTFWGRSAVEIWVAGAACLLAGRLVAGSPIAATLSSSLTQSGAATALGAYVGARRSYFARLHERALFARALAAFLPPEVAKMVEVSPSSLSLEEEVEATIVFSDIRGFSALAERLPTRRVAEIVGRHIGAMAEVVTEHGGTLDKFAGDAVMAVFGVPVGSDDHAKRALGCAVAMQRRQAELNDEGDALDLPRLEIGVGVNSGPVIAGTLGGAGRLDYTVLGDAMNIAQRLESEASAGEILASAATVALVPTAVAESAGPRQLKGRTSPIEVYRVHWDEPA